jgi:hypothetical protein
VYRTTQLQMKIHDISIAFAQHQTLNYNIY